MIDFLLAKYDEAMQDARKTEICLNYNLRFNTVCAFFTCEMKIVI